ncbi:MAG TPA: SDR family oxidoreductase [Streptosporangiaceae bacterium]|nr:SDR family oxidoreductase [Streptosporangiaceae bacterium]
MPKVTRTAIVTGSSTGIGKAIALRLLESGYNVVINYSSDDSAASATLTECQQLSRRRVVMEKGDVSIAADVQRLVQRAVTEFGTLDILINNAARVADKPFMEMAEADWDTVIDVGMKGAFLCSQAAAQQMLGQENGGIILNIGASTGISARRNGINTCASKAGLMIMTQCMALELGPRIRVNTIIPGLTRTAETERRFSLNDSATRAEREATIPLRRIGQPADVAGAVMLALSDDAGFITGQKIVVNGGQYMW